MVRGGLKLKRELATAAPVKPTGPFTVADIWVDASVYHLDTPFSYLIPGNLSSSLHQGSMVSVPFHGREVIGIVVELRSPDSHSGLKSITKVIGSIPLLSQETLELITKASRRYAAHPFDIIRSAIPDRFVKVESQFNFTEDRSINPSVPGKQSYLQLPAGQDRDLLIAKKVAALSEAGSTLVILPDTRHVERVHAYLEELKLEHTILDSQLPKSEYYSNFLKVRTGLSKVVIGTRSAVFAPVNALKSLVIYNEGSENLYEQRSPGWNARDIALLRRQCEDIDLYFIGYSPSSEVARLIDEDWVEFKKTKSKVKLAVTPQVHGELLPSRAIPLIKRALSSGPVLFIVPTKGYAQAIRCSKCRTISRCQCGGAHFKSSAQSPISCSHCLTQVSNWQCSWCNHLIPALASRGIERHQHEIGVLFPGTPTVLSSADHLITEVVDHGIVIATPGMAPKTTAGYRSVVILEGNRFLNQPDMRANERVREMYFAHAALASSDGTVILVQDEGHTIATALTTWNPSIAIHRDLEERSSLRLPPYVRAAILTMETGEITRLKSALEGARAEGRIPAETTLLGPVAHGDKSALILTVDVAHGEELVSTLHEFMRRRSASKKSLPSLRIDPYSLSR